MRLLYRGAVHVELYVGLLGQPRALGAARAAWVHLMVVAPPLTEAVAEPFGPRWGCHQ